MVGTLGTREVVGEMDEKLTHKIDFFLIFFWGGGRHITNTNGCVFLVCGPHVKTKVHDQGGRGLESHLLVGGAKIVLKKKEHHGVKYETCAM